MTTNVQEPTPWEGKFRRCRWCNKDTMHQFVAHKKLWICLECGTVWATPEELKERRNAVAHLTPEDVWGN